MDRRDALKQAALLMGGALTAATLSAVMEGCERPARQGQGGQFTEDETAMLSRMADVVIPRTSTPGAVDAGVPAFIVMMMGDCYPEKAQQAFHEGLAAFDRWCRGEQGDGFLALTPGDQETAVAGLDALVMGKKELPDKALSFYRTFKELTILGYFTSKPGATETLRYVAVPGRYDGCIPYHEGDKAWAT